MGFRQRLAKNPERTPCVVSCAPKTAASGSGFALSLLPAGPRARLLRGQTPAPRVGAPPERVPLLDTIRETPPTPPRKSFPGACPRSGNLQEGNAQGASRGRAPAPPSTAHRRPASCTRTTTYLGVQAERCKGHGRCWTRVEGAAMPSPRENSCRLVHRWAVGGRPGSGT